MLSNILWLKLTHIKHTQKQTEPHPKLCDNVSSVKILFVSPRKDVFDSWYCCHYHYSTLNPKPGTTAIIVPETEFAVAAATEEMDFTQFMFL